MMRNFLDRLSRSFLERNQLLIGSIGIGVVVVGSALALLLSGGVFADTYTVTAEFKDAAGVRPGDGVTVAGLDAGKIGAVHVAGGIVEVDLKINSDVEMPVDSDAEIVVETLLGKKVIALTYGSSNEMLSDGDVIPLERTLTPIEIADLNDASVSLLERSDAEALEELMTHVTNVTEGKEQELETVIDGLADVTAALDSRKTELEGLIESMRTLSVTFAEEDDTIVSLIDRYNVVLGNLAERRHDLATLLTNTDAASHEVADLVADNRGVLDSTFASLHEALQVVDAHQVDLAATIPYLEAAVRGYSSVGYSQGIPNRWANIFVQSLGPVGVDAITGPCGLIDQALDEILGPDPRSCDQRQEFGEGDGDRKSGGNGKKGGGKDGDETDPDDTIDDIIPDDIPLPGDLGDLFDSVTGGLLGGTLR